VNFNGTGTVAIQASGNVSSITDNGTGDYTINFATTMEDVDYAVIGTAGDADLSGLNRHAVQQAAASVIGSCRIVVNNHGNAGLADPTFCSVAIFR